MSKRILLINSDLAKNRGDRAIAEGNIALIKQLFSDAEVTGISQHPNRDKSWYGIDFLNMNFQSLNPLELLRLCRFARKQDFILWGGGEILKDYTNKAALWYWVGKMTLISLANQNLYGAFQGIGPTKSSFSKRLIVFVVRRCKVFIVRDEESYKKLVSWGAPVSRLRFASDPAVLPLPQKMNSDLKKKLLEDYSIDSLFLGNFICIGPRDWFHYKQSSFLPYKYKRRLDSLLKRKEKTESAEHHRYMNQLGEIVSKLTDDLKLNVLLVPMHMEESDPTLCRELMKYAKNPTMVRALDRDNLSPAELRTVISYAQAMIGFRLHSNIIGISAGVPSINIYYVDKGRVFFDQIGQSQFALPIESVLQDNFHTSFFELFDDLLRDRKRVTKNIKRATSTLRKSVLLTFNEVFGRV